MKNLFDRIFGAVVTGTVELLIFILFFLMKIRYKNKKEFKKQMCGLIGGGVFLWLMAEIYTESMKFCEQNNIDTPHDNQIEGKNGTESI